MSIQEVSKDQIVNKVAQLLTESKFVEAEQVCVHILQHNKLASQLWVYLGEALLRQRFKYAATRVFRRALLLDPIASWEEAVWREVELLADDEPRMDIETLLQYKTVTVSAALIVKDEERCIERCIDSIQHAVDEIVIIDTGSTDNTLKLIEQYPNVRLHHYEWTNDFAAARNEALKHVHTEWVYFIDADQYLHPEDVCSIRETAGLHDDMEVPIAFTIGEIQSNQDKATTKFTVTRLFSMRHNIRFWGRVHEHIGGPSGLLSMPILIRPIRLRVFHDGFEISVVEAKGKMERNAKLLEEMLIEEPDNPAWWVYHGRQKLNMGELDAAEFSLKKAEKCAETNQLFGAILNVHMLLMSIYMSRGDLEQAEAVCKRALKKHPDFPDAHYWLGKIKLARVNERLNQAREHFIHAKQAIHTYRGAVSMDHQIREYKLDRELSELAARMSQEGNRQLRVGLDK